MKKSTLLAALAISVATSYAAETEKNFFQFLDHTGWTVSARHDLIPAELNNLLDNNVDTYLTLVQPNKTGINLSDEITNITTGAEVYFMIDMLQPQTFNFIYFRNPHSINGPKNGIGVPDIEKVKGFMVYGGDDAEHLELIYDNSAPASSIVSWPEDLHILEAPITCQVIKVVLTPNSTAGDFLKLPEFDLGSVKKTLVNDETDRSAWSLTTTHALVDNTKAGNLFDTEATPANPTYIALVKPGGKLGSVDLSTQLDAKVGYTVDFGGEKTFDYIQLKNRIGQGNNLRVAGAIFSGSNNGTDFTTLHDSRRLLISKAVDQGFYIPMGESVSYRYIKCEFTSWDVTGNSLQVSDFNIGTITPTSIDAPIAIGSVLSATSVAAGEPILIKTDEAATVELRDLSGKRIAGGVTNSIETAALNSGIYFVTITTETLKVTAKIIIK